MIMFLEMKFQEKRERNLQFRILMTSFSSEIGTWHGQNSTEERRILANWHDPHSQVHYMFSTCINYLPTELFQF